jgi:uncharacterized DUF497 family protein
MVLITYNANNLIKHSITQAEVDEVISSATSVECDLPPSNRGNDRIMIVGFTVKGRLLEIGIEFFEVALHVFHADDASKQLREEFSKRIRGWL